ncbi:hypothetical protein NDA16_002998 [Ustilago loliicola]|nr:hypothetical protein NDA16_002998 [Ustilago loliicola]
MQMPSDLAGSQPLGMHRTPAQYGFHPHSPRQPDLSQSSPDAQRKEPNRAEAAEPHTPRPPNAWILYRSQKFREIQQNRNEQSRSGSSEKPKSQAEISKMISQMWQNEKSSVKQKFEALADEKKLAHQRMYPTYRYRPKKKGKNAKQNSANQSSDQSPPNSHLPGSKKEDKGSFAGGHQERYSPQGSASSAYPADRNSGAGPDRSAPNQSPSSIHNQVGRDMISRKTDYGDRRERGELQVPINYGRSVSGSVSSGEGHFIRSYGNNRLHPYGDRPALFMKQESPRQSNLFEDSQSNASSSYAGSHWPGPDAMAGSSGSTYFDGPRAYTNFGSARMPPPSLMGPGSAGSASLMLSPISPPQRQLVPSQQLQHPIDGNNMDLTEFAGVGGGAPGYGNNGGSFRTTPVTSHTNRLGPIPSFGDASRSEMPTGLAMPGSHEGLPDNFDPHRRI